MDNFTYDFTYVFTFDVLRRWDVFGIFGQF